MSDSIIAGRGRGLPKYESKVRVKALICWFAAILLAGLAMEFWDYARWWGFVPAALSLIAAIVLRLVEKPKSMECWNVRDPGKLYRGK